MARKTVDVTAVRDHANLMLSLVDTHEFSREFRRGIISMVERVLFDTDNYKGFQYLDSEFEPNTNPRILRVDFDPTRVRYF
jgi:hypothetical protein